MHAAFGQRMETQEVCEFYSAPSLDRSRPVGLLIFVLQPLLKKNCRRFEHETQSRNTQPISRVSCKAANGLYKCSDNNLEGRREDFEEAIADEDPRSTTSSEEAPWLDSRCRRTLRIPFCTPWCTGSAAESTSTTKKHSFKKLLQGPSIKYVTLEGEGVREGVTVCDRGGVKSS